jgi:hypothetical protein
MKCHGSVIGFKPEKMEADKKLHVEVRSKVLRTIHITVISLSTY